MNSILGNVYPPFLVLLFKMYRSIQNLCSLSVFLTKLTALVWTETMCDITYLHHLLENLFHLKRMRWYVPLSFLKGLVICQFISYFSIIHQTKINKLIHIEDPLQHITVTLSIAVVNLNLTFPVSRIYPLPGWLLWAQLSD